MSLRLLEDGSDRLLEDGLSDRLLEDGASPPPAVIDLGVALTGTSVTPVAYTGQVASAS